MTDLGWIAVTVVLFLAFVVSEFSVYEDIKQAMEHFDEKERQKQTEKKSDRIE